MTLISALGGSFRYKSSLSFRPNGLGIYCAVSARLFLLRTNLINPIFAGSGLGDYCATRPILGLY
jgi:hypothetical protein